MTELRASFETRRRGVRRAAPPAHGDVARRLLEILLVGAAALLVLALGGCRFVERAAGRHPHDDEGEGGGSEPPLTSEGCVTVGEGFGPSGLAALGVDVVASGLEVPWGIVFIGPSSALVTERPGRLRLLAGGELVPTPVLTLDVAARGDAGLFDVALAPDFPTTRRFYLSYTYARPADGALVMRVERFVLAADARTAASERVILDDLPASEAGSGGRLRFGQDGMLYVGIGDAGDPERAPDAASFGGKLVRVAADGSVPADNPWPQSAAFVSGLHDPRGFDWVDAQTLLVADLGPRGDGRPKGYDEISIARAGDDLGWPAIFGCAQQAGLRTPMLAWRQPNDPGGAVIYRGSALRGWRGSFVVAMLDGKHLHRIVVDPADPSRLRRHEIYLSGDEPSGYGRLRAVVEGPDGALYVTTSNCDGHGNCPASGDRVLRLR